MTYSKVVFFQRISIKGIEKLDQLSNKCAVLVANHQFSLDLFGLFALWGLFEKLTIVSKASLKYLGPFGLAGIKSGVIFIDRKQGKLAHKIIRVMLSVLSLAFLFSYSPLDALSMSSLI